MLNSYKIEVLADGIIRTRHPEHGEQIWSRSKLTYRHKNDPCAQCGLPVGDVALRPVTNKANRMKRICLRHLTGARTWTAKSVPSNESNPGNHPDTDKPDGSLRRQ